MPIFYQIFVYKFEIAKQKFAKLPFHLIMQESYPELKISLQKKASPKHAFPDARNLMKTCGECKNVRRKYSITF